MQVLLQDWTFDQLIVSWLPAAGWLALVQSLWIKITPSAAKTFTETIVAFRPDELQRCAWYQIV